MNQPYSKILSAPIPPSTKNSRSDPSFPFLNIDSKSSTIHQEIIQIESSGEQEENKLSLGPFKRQRYSEPDHLKLNSSSHPAQSKVTDVLNHKMTSNCSSIHDSTLDYEKDNSINPTNVDGYHLEERSIKELNDNEDESDELESQDDHSLKDDQDCLDDEDDEDEERYSLHIEVRLRSNSTILYHTVRNAIAKYIENNFTTLETQAPIPGWQDLKFLVDQVYSVYCAECAHPLSLIPIRSSNLHIHVYELPVEGEDQITMLCANPVDTSELGHEAHDNEDESTGDVAATRIQLPAYCLEGVWESLTYENGLKTKLLNYIYSSIIFAEQNVNQNLIAWHRLVLLHGPPGTGKTSLCKSLAQKVSIRLSGMYQKTELVEINSHSLFSKWFSESGKLVHSLFTKIEQIAQDSDIFVLVLIDEVESLAGCRSSGASGGEPSDALRAVNSLLTALDKLRHYKNILVLTTSNLTGSIDDAFLDRADIKQFIPLPSSAAIYWILQTCLNELIETNILTPRKFLNHKEALMARDEMADQSRVETPGCITQGKSDLKNEMRDKKSTKLLMNYKMMKTEKDEVITECVTEKTVLSSLKLLEISEVASGMSGRSLRRLPLLAHANTSVKIKSESSSKRDKNKCAVDVYLKAMLEVAKDLKENHPIN